jgi:3,4-dihydroxy 2-butanone 4-phosphate synthase/GTP cyclohydrolase II
VAIAPPRGADDLVSPGHVFPLVAKDGGVLVRAGHTEAAVDISRLAGLYPAGVICEVMNDDGSMARLPDLIRFAQRHGLKIGAIADLIAFRRRSERFVERVVDEPFDSAYGGEFRLVIYRNTLDGGEHAALVKGRVDQGQPTLVRMHQVDFFADMLGHLETRRTYVPAALRYIAAHEGPGVAVFLRDPSPHVLSERIGHGHVEYMGRRALREYGVGAQILLDLGVQDMILMSSKTSTPAGLDGYGLKIVGRVPVPSEDQAE